jgi:uncharacterized phage-associated protein
MPAQQPCEAPTSAAAVANYFLAKGCGEAAVPPIDQMKLQKLLFYAHAWHLAILVRPLFDEDFEAWPWGPVVRDIYFQTRDFGRGPVTRQLTRLAISPGQSILNAKFEAPVVDGDATKEFLDAVWSSHKNYSGVQLSNATHAEGEPWAIVRDTYGNLDHKPTIPNELIAEVFRKKIKNVSA